MPAIITTLMQCVSVQGDRLVETVKFRNIYGGATDATDNTGQNARSDGVPTPPGELTIRNTKASAMGLFAKKANYSVAISAA